MPVRTKARTKGRKPAPAEDRRTAILDATLRLIAAEGVSAVSHRRVAALARVPLGSTTYYFDSREHLLRDAFHRYLERVQPLLDDARLPSSADADIEAFVDGLVRVTRLGFQDEPMVLAEYELTLYAARDAEVARALHAWDARMVADLARMLESLGAARPFDAARTLVHLIRGHELDGLSRHDANPQALRQHILAVTRALVAPTPSPARAKPRRRRGKRIDPSRLVAVTGRAKS